MVPQKVAITMFQRAWDPEAWREGSLDTGWDQRPDCPTDSPDSFLASLDLCFPIFKMRGFT